MHIHLPHHDPHHTREESKVVHALVDSAKRKSIGFADVIAFIDEHYDFTPVAFGNGKQKNAKNENNGSAKVFGLAKIFHLSQEDTLWLFVEHFQSVLDTPNSDNHANIRNFRKFGWEGIEMHDNPLTPKS